MSGLIRKGGFRERANRSRHYQQSENHQAQLAPQLYQPQDGSTQASSHQDQPTQDDCSKTQSPPIVQNTLEQCSLERTPHIQPEPNRK